jgi:hypothetical protein
MSRIRLVGVFTLLYSPENPSRIPLCVLDLLLGLLVQWTPYIGDME